MLKQVAPRDQCQRPVLPPQYRKEDAAAYEAAHRTTDQVLARTSRAPVRQLGGRLPRGGALARLRRLPRAGGAVLCDRLFKQLAIPREEVFTQAEWGLVRDSYSPPYFPGC